jgi:hypothetical protein
MKKLLLLVIGTCLLAFGPNAFADEEMCGYLNVLEITIYESIDSNDVPISNCDLWIDFTFDSGQGPYTIPATAFGTQLNLALLKAYNYNETIDGCLLLTILPPNNFTVKVHNVTFGEVTPTCKGYCQ